MADPRSDSSLLQTLTDRQRKVLELLVRGRTNPEIAEELGVSLDGAKWHLREIFAKLGVDSREEASEAWREYNSARSRARRAMTPLLSWVTLTRLTTGGATVAIGASVVAAGIAMATRTGDAQDAASPSPTPGPLYSVVRVDSHSMLPTLPAGTLYILDVLAYLDVAPTRGDIIAFVDPRKSDDVLVKRVIAVSGDTVEIADGVVILNGTALAEDYVAAPWIGTHRMILIPDGQVYVLGDNRDNSLDSRSPGIGLVPVALVVGRVRP